MVDANKFLYIEKKARSPYLNGARLTFNPYAAHCGARWLRRIL